MVIAPNTTTVTGTTNPQDIPKPSLTPESNDLQGNTAKGSTDSSKIPVGKSQVSIVPITGVNTTTAEVQTTPAGHSYGVVLWLLAFVVLVAAIVLLVRARQRGVW